MIHVFDHIWTPKEPSELKIRPIPKARYAPNDAASLQDQSGRLHKKFPKIEKITFFRFFFSRFGLDLDTESTFRAENKTSPYRKIYSKTYSHQIL